MRDRYVQAREWFYDECRLARFTRRGRMERAAAKGMLARTAAQGIRHNRW